jgi:uncharacterized damage-inducible protein DinB
MATPTSDPLDVLLAHNHWATRKVLDLCRDLSDEQYHASYPIGPAEEGGLHATLTHIVGAMRRWSDRIAERPVRPSIEQPWPGLNEPTDDRDRTPEELSALLSEATEDLRRVVELAKARGLETTFTAVFGGKPYTFTRGAALVHALTHGHYHRAQCMNILRQLRVVGGDKPTPDLDVSEWQVVEGVAH